MLYLSKLELLRRFLGLKPADIPLKRSHELGMTLSLLFLNHILRAISIVVFRT